MAVEISGDLGAIRNEADGVSFAEFEPFLYAAEDAVVFAVLYCQGPVGALGAHRPQVESIRALMVQNDPQRVIVRRAYFESDFPVSKMAGFVQEKYTAGTLHFRRVFHGPISGLPDVRSLLDGSGVEFPLTRGSGTGSIDCSPHFRIERDEEGINLNGLFSDWLGCPFPSKARACNKVFFRIVSAAV